MNLGMRTSRQDTGASLFDARHIRVALNPGKYPRGCRGTVTRSTRVAFSCANCERGVSIGEPSVSLNSLVLVRLCIACAKDHRV